MSAPSRFADQIGYRRAMSFDLVCIGLTTLDVVVRPIDALPEREQTILVDGIEIVPAGTACGAALVAGALGLKTAIAGAVGDDRKGRFLRAVLEEVGVATDLLETVAGSATSTTVLAVDSEGRRPAFHALGASFQYQITPAVLAAARQARAVHWGGVGSRNLDRGPGAELMAQAKSAGALTTCDLISPNKHALDELKRLLPHVDYFLPSAVEARMLSGQEELTAAAAFFRDLGAGACVIKNGAAGSILGLADRTATLPAHAIAPVDTTSCGDSYCAGFIAALLRGFDAIEAARFATTTAALVAQGLGTLGKLESFEATRAAMLTLPLQEAA
jgi:sugar/nucleoside kinase (ribokinase family)